MWLVHIDTWNYPDPQKIIDLIPEDIRPFVVMNISLSINHDDDGKWLRLGDGYETAKSWLRVCAENRMWAMIQQASGGYNHLGDYDLGVYEDFYRNYPNFIGFNYAEQFWGFNDPPLSPPWTDRIAHFANLLELNNKYGGYLVVSWCGNQWGPSINPMGMMKRNPDFAEACRLYTENFILCEKYTQQAYQSDMESLCLGAYLSGYSGQYGIRYDDTGWTDVNGDASHFSPATGGAPHLEHTMLTGETVIDGPELIWTQCFRGLSDGSAGDGYTQRRWDTYSQFDNVSVDLFRKILDGTVRIPTRQEVIDRTKVVIVHDVNTGNDDEVYSTPGSLFEGLYRMDGDGNLRDNKTFFKKTGRYPTIPTVFDLDDAPAQSFQVQINKSAYSSRWPSIGAKQSELNSLFPEEYTGDIYAGRHENGWVVYNPYKTTTTIQTASGTIPFKYNTCESIELTLSQYTSGIIKEYADHLDIYLNNYDNEVGFGMRTDTIKIHGSTSQPTYSFTDRGNHQASVLSESWVGGVFTLTVQHNGPLDMTINCEGTAEGRLTAYTSAAITAPDQPMEYTGPRQYEGECFDFKSIDGIDWNAAPGSILNFTGQGFLRFGSSSSAAVRDTVTVLKAGTYRIETRYSNAGGNRSNIHLYVNGVDAATPVFANTGSYSSWQNVDEEIILNAGENTIEFKAAGTGANVYFDNIVVVPTASGDGTVIQENASGFAGMDGTIETSYTGYTGDGYVDTDNAAGTGIDWALNFDSSVVKAFTFRYASSANQTAELLINGTNVASDVLFPATGSLSNWDYVTVYAAVASGEAGVRLQAVSSAGLPNIDYMEVVGGAPWMQGTVPFRPQGLTASPVSTSQIDLTWLIAPGADRYTVKRASSSGGPYIAIASNVVEHSFNDTGLAELSTYYYVVSAANAAGESADSAEADATTQTTHPPAAPTGFGATPTSFDQINLSWTASVGADHYIVKRSASSGGPYTTVGIGIAGTSFLDSGLFADTAYYYVVSAVNDIGEGANSSEAVASTLSSATIAPVADTYVRDGSADTNFGTDTQLAVKNDGGGGYTRISYLKFDVSGLADADSVQLRMTPYQVDANVTLAHELVTDDSWTEAGMTWNNQPSGALATIANVSGYTVGQQKSVTVTGAATDEAAGDGILSIKISKATSDWPFVGFNSREAANSSLHPQLYCTFTHIDYPVPGTPGGLVATAVSGSRIDLSWSASSGATRYNVYRSSTSGGAYTLIAASVTGTSYSDSGLADGMTYYYAVSAVNGTGESPLSSEAGATTSARLPYGGIPWTVPGTVEAEDYDTGGPGLAYNDADTGNNGGAYRNDDVDVEVCGEGGYNVGWIGTGEWLEYSVDVTFSGSYEITLRAASIFGTGEVHVEFDGVDATGPVSVSNTGDWQTYTDVSAGYVALTAGRHIMRVFADGPDFNINHITLTAQPPGTPTELVAVPVSAEQVDLAWSDAAGAQYYAVKRSVSSGGPYGVVASNVMANSFSDDSGLAAGTRYYYVVNAVNVSGTSDDSEETSVVPSAEISPDEYIWDEVVVSNGILALTVSNSMPGHSYFLLGKEHLTDPDWFVTSPVSGNGTNVIYSYAIDGFPSTFFFKLDVQRQ
ncbi:MAG: carbohydrate-binding protein [Pontiellaceae bacterium]|nr:carbohydrate-binding protein [Pontiellaceae bacterium]